MMQNISSMELLKFDMHYILNVLNYLSTLSFFLDMLTIFTGTVTFIDMISRV